MTHESTAPIDPDREQYLINELIAAYSAHCRLRNGETAVEGRLAAVVLGEATTITAELADARSPVFLEHARELGRMALAGSSKAADLEKRAEHFSDGVYPAVEEALRLERERVGAAVPLGDSVAAWALSMRGVTTYGQLAAFLRGEGLEPPRRRLVVDLTDAQEVRIADPARPDHIESIEYVLPGRGEDKKWGALGLGGVRRELTRQLLERFAADPNVVITSGEVRAWLAERVAPDTLHNAAQSIYSWWIMGRASLEFNGERIIEEEKVRGKMAFRLNRAFAVALPTAQAAGGSSSEHRNSSVY